MLLLTIDNPEIENYFSNSADRLKEFLERFVNEDIEFTKENAKQYAKAVKNLAKKETISTQNARAILNL